MLATFWLESLKGRDYFEDVGVDGWIILKWILGKECWKVWIGFIRLRVGSGAGSCVHGNEPSVSVKGGLFLTS
jgi:hypothetical protein